ncbi:hypothetical protein AN641_05820 [Candidatus Epulonipiscioides gigas]|nr:hypothetical protein AN641_05820 [Epulopiscium sp. SCG-C07WGA-EpuloA2]
MRCRMINKFLAKLDIKKKLIFLGYAITVPILIVICIMLFISNLNSSKKSQIESTQKELSSLNDSLNIVLEDIKNLSTYISINEQITKLLTTSDDTINNNPQLWYDYAPMQIIHDMISIEGYIKTIAIYPENNIRPYLRGLDGSSYNSDFKNLKSSKLYNQTLLSSNNMLWQNFNKGTNELYDYNRTDKLVLSRIIYDISRTKILGYLVIGCSTDKFYDIIEHNIKFDDETVIIFNSRGDNILTYGDLNSKLNNYLLSQEFQDILKKSSNTYIEHSNHTIYLSKTNENSTIACKIVPSFKILNNLIVLIDWPLSLFIGVLISLLPILMLLSKIITAPLINLSKNMEKFSKGDFEQYIIINSNDELAQVGKCFNNMVDNIKILIEENYIIKLKEQESELLALQAQINPHFLYNTLNSLYWQALNEGYEELAESVLSLSDLFRLVLNQGQKEVPIAKEMLLVRKYLEVQNLRFYNRLTYSIKVDKNVEDFIIPKLVIQPFVENAIVHAFENTSSDCEISIIVKQINDYIEFRISDTGIGMTQEKINQLFDRESEFYQKQRIGGYAIKNIMERLELKYKSKFSLFIESKENIGTTIILIIYKNVGM